MIKSWLILMIVIVALGLLSISILLSNTNIEKSPGYHRNEFIDLEIYIEIIQNLIDNVPMPPVISSPPEGGDIHPPGQPWHCDDITLTCENHPTGFGAGALYQPAQCKIYVNKKNAENICGPSVCESTSSAEIQKTNFETKRDNTNNYNPYSCILLHEMKHVEDFNELEGSEVSFRKCETEQSAFKVVQECLDKFINDRCTIYPNNADIEKWRELCAKLETMRKKNIAYENFNKCICDNGPTEPYGSICDYCINQLHQELLEAGIEIAQGISVWQEQIANSYCSEFP